MDSYQEVNIPDWTLEPLVVPDSLVNLLIRFNWWEILVKAAKEEEE